MLCNRCKYDGPAWTRCPECGVHKDRIVRKLGRRRPIGGKRGRNSGTVGSSKKKK